MAIPIRIASGDSTIPLVAESIDINLQRQLSAFPVPGTSDRVAIDMNLPQIEIDINGVLVDDDASMSSLDVESMHRGAESFNFAGIFPRSIVSTDDFFGSYRTNAVTSGDTEVDVYNFEWPGGDVVSTVGMHLYTLQGEHIGEVFNLSVSLNNDGPPTVRKFGLLNPTTLDVPDGDRIIITQFEYGGSSGTPGAFLLHDEELSFWPNYWRDANNTPTGVVTPVVLRFKEDQVSNRSTVGGGVGPTLVSPYDSADISSSILIDVPVGGIWFDSTNGDPAKTLALMVQDALTLSTNIITNGRIHPNGGKSLSDAFEVSLLDAIVIVRQKYVPSTNLSNVTVSAESEFKESLGYKSYENLPASNNYVKSAGDKVQDLMGIFANSDDGIDQIRGIQIPYDSLITSDSVTPVARNFFLTAGNVTPASKSSDSNLIPASDKMLSLGKSYRNAGNESDPDEDITDLLGATGEFIRDFVDFLGSAAETIMATIDRTPVANQGGMRILPVSFHARYDAGNKYYNFDMKLIASDFVIGV